MMKEAANALGDLGSLALDRGDYEQATSLLERSWTLHRKLGAKKRLLAYSIASEYWLRPKET